MQVWCFVLFTGVVFRREVSLVVICRHCKGSVVVKKTLAHRYLLLFGSPKAG